MSSPDTPRRRSARLAASPRNIQPSLVELEVYNKQEVEKENKQQAEVQKQKNTHKANKVGNVGGRKRKKKTVIQEEADFAELEAEGATLIDVVLNHPQKVSAGVKKWLEEYTDNQQKGMAELWSLIVQVAGVNIIIREDEISALQLDTLLAQMTESVKRDGLQGHIYTKGYNTTKEATVEVMEGIVSEEPPRKGKEKKKGKKY
eukprot:TRINITY_DN108011_c0_g1_i2.p1 TRINITY_DN108011_c0_g1~~TRINITY_DN108011_c0_g1_i2.p1  ORF type:complete len:203 (-),score=46.50 TRINITY_DN108011_c0_g1_i2:29-637(-)